ncbi:MAG TPA: patatin-like phospholipase family protein [Actinomycetota bacterium]|nr:patatin-like phospholipase family protein [Actinomycetota bacterium]
MSVRDLFAGRRHPRTAFVLGGGGNLGCIQVGMLRALFERGIAPDLVVGCSVGALNGAAVAHDPTLDGVTKLEAMWRRLESGDVFPSGRMSGPWLLLRKGTALYPNTGLRAAIDASFPEATFEGCRVPLHVVATSMTSGRSRWFSSGPLAEPLLASSALPAVFPPVETEGDHFIDGGVIDNVPISKAVELGARRIYVLHVGNFERPAPMPRRPLDVLVRAFSIARSYRFMVEHANAPDGVEVVTLPGVQPPRALRHNDFSASAVLMDRAYLSASTFLSTPAAAAGS